MTKGLFPTVAAAREYGPQVAIIDDDTRLTYAQLSAAVDRLALVLQEHGIGPSQRVLVHHAFDRQTILLFYAVQRLGAVFVPVSERLPPKQLRHFAKTCQATHFICTMQQMHSLSEQGIPAIIRDTLPWETLLSEEAFESPLPETISLTQEATIIRTSGSTHEPKAALHLYKNHYYNALGSNQNIELGSGDKWLLTLPIFHVAGIAILMRCVLSGAAVTLPRPQAELGDDIIRTQATHLSLVSTQLARLLQEGPDTAQAMANTKGILLGGSAISEKLLRKARKKGWPLYTSYGATEMASQIATTRPNAPVEELGNKAHLLPYRELAIDESSEIKVKGETLFAGYVTPEGLDLPFDEEGWFATGDLGEWNEDGSLRITGRKDAMFISGGENIQPEEIERVLLMHQDVEQAIVVDIPSEEYGARPCAFVKMKPKKRLHSQELRRFLRTHLAGFKVPDRFYRWPNEERKEGIKPSRARFREIARRS